MVRVNTPGHFQDSKSRERSRKAHHPDIGCEISKKCTLCPLGGCRHDVGARQREMMERAKQMRKMYDELKAEGVKGRAKRIAARFGVCERTVRENIQKV